MSLIRYAWFLSKLSDILVKIGSNVFFYTFREKYVYEFRETCICYENFAFKKLFILLAKVFTFVLPRICSGFINIFREYAEKKFPFNSRKTDKNRWFSLQENLHASSLLAGSTTARNDTGKLRKNYIFVVKPPF